MKRTIAVITGGDSAEFEISLQTASLIFSSLDTENYTPFLVMLKGTDWNVKIEDRYYPIDLNDFSFSVDNKKVKFDFAYIGIHGTPGENGILQGYLNLLNIPHSTSDVFSSALSFDKHACNTYLKSFGYSVAKSILLKRGQNYSTKAIEEKLGMPCFVKPNADGSSFGISKVKKVKDLDGAIKKAFMEGKEVIIEEFIDGLEYTCGLVKTKKESIIFPITEIVPKNEFFDYESKYDPTRMAEEITPARISEELTLQFKNLSSEIYDVLKCKGIVRVDYMLRNDEIFILEANTVPGMTATSFIPQQVAAMNKDLKDILSMVIEDEF
ncbi:D-alanine--D-alanine ligase [Labilibaculum antarcticum]|uniref:D-alanine--D-alanine ligase n=1 Tax=Labilibaculum antarcticum TaxID=1717717 RepID=A0A1Y1CJU1_9BACT|nr:D-alanine--D-alanine ligase [Labilibaculum antarcticum]BAX80668.1 D-alanine--D-alanine ligase A [Labilibaculum antarcticum]